jgi:phosphatidylserine/phosphatidylglycerophosphate/cardiolipin synthase-like enzyme
VTDELEGAAARAVQALGPHAVRRFAAGLRAGERRDVLLVDLEAAGSVELTVLLATAERSGLPDSLVAAYLTGVAAGYSHQSARVHAEAVWTGPYSFDVPVRTTAQVLTDVIEEAEREVVLATYSAKPYPALRTALSAAVHRGVSVWIVVETLHGAGSAIQGDQPAQAFADLSGVALWTWDVGRRTEGAKMHAKLAVADERTLFVSSANLTTFGIETNMEAGVLVRGGSAPRRTIEHLRALRRDGALVRI